MIKNTITWKLENVPNEPIGLAEEITSQHVESQNVECF